MNPTVSGSAQLQIHSDCRRDCGKNEIQYAQRDACGRHRRATNRGRLIACRMTRHVSGDDRRQTGDRAETQQDPAHEGNDRGGARGRLLAARQACSRINRHGVQCDRLGRAGDRFARSLRRTVASRSRRAVAGRAGWPVASRRSIAPALCRTRSSGIARGRKQGKHGADTSPKGQIASNAKTRFR